MKIQHLTMHNFRRCTHTFFQFHDQFTMIIGNNGTGKTTILDALAIMLNTYFMKSDIPTGGGTIKAADARLVYKQTEGQVFANPQKEVWLQASVLKDNKIITWKRALGDRGGKAKELVAEGKADRFMGLDYALSLPLLLYYGTGRLWNTHPNVKTGKPSSQLEAYRYCLDPKSDHRAFEKWFKTLTLSQLQKQSKIPAIDAVKNAVMTCIPGAQNFYFDVGQDSIMINLEKEGLTRFNDLSDGFKNMVAMVADIAHRASRLNPDLGEQAAIKTTGIVLIDEIDLHLHPKWQRRVVDDLQKAFPNMQFIATTHSPFIIQSLEHGQIIDLATEAPLSNTDFAQKGDAAPAPQKEFANRSIEDIVEDIMGVEVPQRSARYQEMYETAKRYYSILDQAKEKNTNTLLEKEKLKKKLDELIAPFSVNVAYYAFLEMERKLAGIDTTQDKVAK